MTKKLLLSTVAAVALTTSLSADFSFGDMFKDMKDGATSMSKDAKELGQSSVDGGVEVSKSGERTVTSVSNDVKDSSVKDYHLWQVAYKEATKRGFIPTITNNEALGDNT